MWLRRWSRRGFRVCVGVSGCARGGPTYEGSKDTWSVSVEQVSGGVVGTGSCSRLSLVTLTRGWALGTTGTRTTVSRVPVDGVPDRLPGSLELGLDESDDGGLG